MAFLLTMAVVLSVLAMLPTAFTSMVEELEGQSQDKIYDLFTGEVVDPNRTVGPEAAFVNVAVTNLDESRRVASLTISGHRVCANLCPQITGTFYSLGNDSARRRVWLLHLCHRAAYQRHAATLSL